MSELAKITGASDVFRGGVLMYATPLKHKLLGVDTDVVMEGVVSSKVARQMARGVHNKTVCHDVATTWGLSTTGVAGPDPQDDIPIGMVYTAIAHDKHSDILGPFHFKAEGKD
jgi:nicotinamide-nucleotide amidase